MRKENAGPRQVGRGPLKAAPLLLALWRGQALGPLLGNVDLVLVTATSAAPAAGARSRSS
jgi:hypothetical protein